MNKLTILVYADKSYDMFVIPYIYYALKSNDAFVEVVLDSYEAFLSFNKSGLELLESFFPNKFLVRQSAFDANKYLKNTIRFLETPTSQTDYIYIGDIDILIFEDLVSVHESLMNKYNLPFSNVIRPKKEEGGISRLTGLHFCRYTDYYPLPDLSDLDLMKENDEHVLYEIMLRKGLMVDENFSLRPECGIHMSLSRDPVGRYFVKPKIVDLNKNGLGWGGKQYYLKFLQSLDSADYKEIQIFFSITFKYLSLLLESIAKDCFQELQQVSFSYGFDKRFITDKKDLNYFDMKEERKKHLDEKNYSMALSVTKNMILIWNADINLYLDLAWSYLALGDQKNAKNVFEMIQHMDNGVNVLTNCNFYQNYINSQNDSAN